MDPSGNTVRATSSAQMSARSEPRTGTAEKPTTEKRKPVRRDPEKRRQQNIQAQKKYREKLKKRLDHLETIAASVADNKTLANLTLAVTPEADPNIALPPTSSSGSVTASEHTSPIQHPHHMTHHSYDHSSDSSVFSDLTTLSTSISPAASSDITLWDPTTSIDPSHLIHDPAHSHGHTHTHKIDPNSKTQFWVGFVDCGCLRPHVQIDQVTETGERQYRNLPVLNMDPNFLLADPYINTLRCERLCVVQAVMSNCMHIGITEDMFCDDEAISPFFRPGGDNVDDSRPDNMVRKIQSIFKTLKPDVRPIKEQITIVHPPVIDVLPFPTFRKNLIKSKDAIDEDELYDDLLNGLVCWGGSGVGGRDRDVSTGYVSTGTPWDSRSWEGRTWFLQKYWAMLGGEDGELVRQSEWWRNVRGEESDPWLVV